MFLHVKRGEIVNSQRYANAEWLVFIEKTKRGHMKNYVGLKERLQGGLCLASLLAGLFLLLSSCSFAQVSTASLKGVVRDPKGAIVANATVVLRNVDTSVENTTVSNGSGAYTFLSITPGRYTLEATATGFKSTQVPTFTLTVGQAASIDFSLTLGTQTSVVTVQGAAPQLETSSANLGTVIGTQQVNDLPLNGRNFTQLLALTPGVAPVSTGQNNNHGIVGSFNVLPAAANSSFSIPTVNGQTSRSDFFLMDGLIDYGSLLSTYAVPPIIDAIQEFKVVSHTDSAEFGSVLGGVVNVVTKSGTNEFHGSAWTFDRDQIFDARTYFLPTDVAKTPYHQNQFGGAIGGPVWIPKLYNGRNKTFFFGAYQGFRYSQTSNTPLKVPTAAQLAGNESDWPTQIYNPFTTRPDPAHPGQYIRDPYPGNIITTGIDPTIVAYAKFVFPAAGPVFDSSGDNALDTTPTTQNQNEWNIRIDQKIGANDSAWFRYSLIRSTATASGGLPGLPTTTETPASNWGGSYVHVFNPSLVLQLQFGHTILGDNSTTLFAKSTAGIFNQVGFATAFAGNFTASSGGDLLPSPGISGYANGGESIQNEPKSTDSYQYSGSLTKTVGNHEVHMGGGYITAGFASPISYASLSYAAQNTGDTNPLDTVNSGDPIASFILNVPGGANRRNVNETLRPGGVLSAFVQDSWRATPKLTLNIGLRYDLTFIPPYGTNATIGQQGGPEAGDVDFSNGTYIVQILPPSCSARGHAPCIPGDGSLPAHVVVSPNGKIAHNTYTNLGPRFGFAYRATEKTVVRGAFGIVYDNWAAVTQMAQNIEGTWPDIGQQIANNLNQPSTTSAVPTYKTQDPFGNSTSSLFPAPTPFNQVSWFYDPHIKNSYSEQWNFGVQQMVNPSTTMTANYVGSVTRRANVGGYYNTALTPGPGDPQARAMYPYIAPTFYDRSVGSANYNAFQFSLNKRYTNGLSYSVAYTWSKSINVGDDGWFGVEGSVAQDPYNPAAYGSRSVAGTDLTNIFSVNTLYQIPVGTGKRFSTGNRVLNYILGNWQENNIFQAYSGLPFMPVTSSDIANTGNGATYETLDIVGNPHLSKRTPAEWFNTAAYKVPAGYTYGTTGRNSLRSAPYWELDSSLFKQFPIGEGRQFEFRAEAFNLLNNPVFGTPNTNINNGTAFGTIDGTANTSREIQLGAKFIF
ncbi:MAG TPA: carboxypeptidase regulatory-like domain-containing protein [Acidobacteriaceae bacterium]|jgi:hypothetical protein|nr:carboxypeptidase regulatory-like domain-containing protein [Acidobacteriaceae bacterium]